MAGARVAVAIAGVRPRQARPRAPQRRPGQARQARLRRARSGGAAKAQSRVHRRHSAAKVSASRHSQCTGAAIVDHAGEHTMIGLFPPIARLPLASHTRQLGFGLGDLPKIDDREFGVDALSEVASIQSNPAAQHVGMIVHPANMRRYAGYGDDLGQAAAQSGPQPPLSGGQAPEAGSAGLQTRPACPYPAAPRDRIARLADRRPATSAHQGDEKKATRQEGTPRRPDRRRKHERHDGKAPAQPPQRPSRVHGRAGPGIDD